MKKLLRLVYSLFNKSRVISSRGGLFINGFSILSKRTVLGMNCHFNGMRIKGKGDVKIGDNFHSGSGCKIITTYHDYDNGSHIPYGVEEVHKNIMIGNNVWIGEDVLILGGVTIQDGAIIQAGSVVTSDIGYCEIAGGSPAKVFKKRNVKHYEDLRSKGKYH